MALKDLKNLSLLNKKEIIRQIRRLRDIKRKLEGKVNKNVRSEILEKMKEKIDDIDEMFLELELDRKEYEKIYNIVNEEIINE